MAASLSRRRGTRSNPNPNVILLALCAAIFAAGLAAGTLLLWAAGNAGNDDGVATAPDASPLRAALGREAALLRKGERRAVAGMHQQFERAVEGERRAVDSLKGRIAGLRAVHHENEYGAPAGDSSSPHYPYMTAPVSPHHDFQSYEPLGGNRFVEYKDGDAPYTITAEIQWQSDELARSRRHHVKEAMKHVWTNYKQYAWGRDELQPVSGNARDNFGGIGATLVDSLDTLLMMGMKEEFYEGRNWVRDHLSFQHVGPVSGFETTIRSLGGLLSAYDLSGDDVFLKKAEDLASRLIKAYDTPSGLPHGNVDLSSGFSHNFDWNENAYILAEVGTQQVEYRYFSRVTGKKEYASKSEHVFDVLRKLQPSDGLFMQNLVDGGGCSAYESLLARILCRFGWSSYRGTPTFVESRVSFGACGDSTYEYMLKLWLQSGRRESKYRRMWDKAIQGMHDQLLQKSHPNGLAFIGDRDRGIIQRKMDHLVCFMGGALALGAYTDPKGLDSERAQRDLRTARALTYTCYQMYARTKSGIAPEYVDFEGSDDMETPSSAPFYILRPETVEALYYLSKLTGDPIYREWGWEIFQSIEKYCKVEHGYGSLHNVGDPNGEVEDRMESFFLAETLKYLYLLFDPNSELDLLNGVVFNTEAHPLKIFQG